MNEATREAHEAQQESLLLCASMRIRCFPPQTDPDFQLRRTDRACPLPRQVEMAMQCLGCLRRCNLPDRLPSTTTNLSHCRRHPKTTAKPRLGLSPVCSDSSAWERCRFASQSAVFHDFAPEWQFLLPSLLQHYFP